MHPSSNHRSSKQSVFGSWTRGESLADREAAKVSLESSSRYIIFDFTGIEDIDDWGLGVFFKEAQRLLHSGQKVEWFFPGPRRRNAAHQELIKHAQGVDILVTRPMDRFTCMDCACSAGDYMVKPHVWSQVFSDRKGIICIFCFEARLGRPLTRPDLLEVPSNQALFYALDRIKK